MKKKVYLAAMAMCAALAAAGCGVQTQTEGETAQTEADTQKEDTAEETQGEEEISQEEPVSFGTRLVSVDNVEKYITIGEYKGLTLDNTVAEVTDDQVEAQIENILSNSREEVTDSKATVQEGDLVTINFVGTKDGVAFDGGTANNYDVTIGEGKMIEGFEDGIIGMKTGESRDLNLTFPEDYPEASMAGQDVVFKITLQKFRRAPELTDAWVAANSEAETVAQYRELIREQLTEDARKTAEDTLRQTAWNTVLNNSEVKEYPQEDLDNARADFHSIYEEYAKQGGMELEEFVESMGMTMEDFEEQAGQYAELKIKQNLLIQGIMDTEGLALDDEESLALSEELAETYGTGDVEELTARYGEAAVNESIGLLRVEDFIIENAQVNELVSNGSLVGQSGDGGAAAQTETEETAEEAQEE